MNWRLKILAKIFLSRLPVPYSVWKKNEVIPVREYGLVSLRKQNIPNAFQALQGAATRVWLYNA